jgi:hypothetical protein
MGQLRGGAGRELDPLFQQPTRQIGGQLPRALFEVVEGRRLRFGGGEEPIQESVGVLLPLLAELFAVSRRRSGHGDTFLE